MVFSRIVDVISSFRSHLSASRSSTAPYMSSGLPSQSDSGHGLDFSGSAQKKNLRLSSSLQDLSAYRQLDPEEGDLNPGIDRSVIHAKQIHPLLRENGVSSFSKEKALPGTPFVRRKWVRSILIFLCLLLLAFLIFVFLKFFYSNWSQRASQFYVVLDCGSTGTRVYVYQASIDHRKGGNVPIVLKSLPESFHRKSGSQSGRAYNRMETEPGFDKLVNNESGLRAAIKPLLQWAEKQIPKHAHKRTALFLCATAGVRRLPSADSEWILNNAWSILKKSPFLCHRDWIRIISGVEEAYYGWIALNYHTGMLGAIEKKATYGALDLGGSSLQVTFESNKHAHNETSLSLSIGSVKHHLTAYSLAGYGLNDAFDKSVIHLLKRHTKITKKDLIKGNIELKHPCLQSGYKKQYICSRCTSIVEEGGIPRGERNLRQGGKRGIPLTLTGAPKWEECSALAKVAVNLSEWSDLSPGIDCELQPCALADNLPRPYGEFYALSGFFVVYRFFNLTPEATLDDVLEKGQDFCERTWEVAKNSVPPQPFIEQYCFRAPYVTLLLREGLHITDSHVIIGSGSISWTLGVALLEAGKALPGRMRFYGRELFQMKINPIILFAILLSSLILLVFALSCVGNWMPRLFRRSYLPLFRHSSASSASVLRFQRWSPISSGDGRVKMPLSPTIAGAQQRPFDIDHGFGGSNIQLVESSLYPSTSGVSHSYSSGSLGQMHFDNSSMGSFRSPHRGQMRLQSRRSQSREDLNSSLAEAHLTKV
ncbi:probable apyrase 7 [Malania oleifera]|uniref:probable apyrase 7 n=1 Tax=Malania oleifera TaxID=397392 RepID=UPI0025AE80AA|nr:probable apyrase 7 [Malania oleifera]XP_057981581.1 probable apyrase 7 [Malania oleifera]